MRTRLKHLDRKLLGGLILVAILLAVSLFQPALNTLILGDQNPLTVGAFPVYEEPSARHLLGTDRQGRDILAITILSLKYSLAIGALAGMISTIIGIIVGFMAGYKGGRMDTVLRSMTDMILVIPSLPILMTLSAYVKTLNIVTMALILAVFSWPFSARVIRSQVMSLREAPYIDLAKLTNMRDAEVIFFEILPNLLPFLGVSFAGSVVGAMLAATGLEVLGLGPSNITTLGMMINLAIGQGALSLGKWNMIFPPIFVLILVFLGVQLINMGLEVTYNPRLRR
ncbi:MAG: ABC transporter permease [Firmicutes bacterium]|nr:ABC transporter permease [Bacillota bacterium]